MQSRRDQVQAHLFVVSRLSAGMQRADPDASDVPSSRTGRGIVGGVVVAALAAVGVALYGLIVPGGNTAWRTPGTMVVVSGSGGRYLYVGGALHPVLNDASAKLVAGAQMTVHTVDAASLTGVPHGAPIGIVGAPDSLPAASASGSSPGVSGTSGSGSLYAGPWSACSGRLKIASGDTGSVLSLVIGPLSAGQPLSSSQATLVSGSSGDVQMLWHGQRFRVDTADGAETALGWSGTTPLGVSDAFLDTLTVGPDLASPAVSGRGGAGPVLSGRPTRYGQLFTGPSGQHYLLRQDGLVPLTPLLFDLLRGDPRTQAEAYGGGAVTATAIGPADLVAHQAPASVAPQLAQDLPDTAPQLVIASTQQEVCSTVTPRGSTPSTSVTLMDAAGVPSGAANLQPGVRQGCLEANSIWVKPGVGVIVRALSSAGMGSSQYLVTDAGVAYPLPASGAAKLGFDSTSSVAMPAQWLQLLPAGPGLDPSKVAYGGVVQPASTSANCATSP